MSRRDVMKAGTAVAGVGGFSTASQAELVYAPTSDSAVTVTIKRDEYGVPHIYARDADSRTPVFYGFGYVTAQDRLYQLELYRRYYHGTVAEVLGAGEGDADWVQFDKEARRNTAGEPSLDEQAQEQLTADQRDALQAFTDGINRYIQEVREDDEREFHKGFQEHLEPDEFTTEDAAGMFVGSMAYFSGFQLETLSATVVDMLSSKRPAARSARWSCSRTSTGERPGAPTSTTQPDAGIRL